MDFVSTERAPQAIGPYSQAVIADGLVFTAGQIALDPATGEVVAGGVAEQTERVFANLKAILEIYARAFGQHRPARSTVAVAALPRGVRVEIDVIARRGR